jgi:hypothetical protein
MVRKATRSKSKRVKYLLVEEKKKDRFKGRLHPALETISIGLAHSEGGDISRLRV